MERTYQTKLEIESDKIIYNINSIKKYVGDNVNIMPIIKDDGYKTKLNEQIDIFEKTNINIVGVAICDEAVKIRGLGYQKEIFILNPINIEDIPNIIKYNITVGIGSIDFLKELGKYKEKIKIHIEIGTGMGRTGINPNKTKIFIEEAKKYKNIEIEGIYTHFACSDSDKEYTEKQIKSFNKAIEIAESEGIKFKYKHCCNSAGIINFRQAHFNLVRPGIILYGYYPDQKLAEKLQLKPAIKLKSKISFLKEVPEETSISYGRTFITKRTSKIATIQIGYADGIRRSLSNKGSVVINGKIVPIVGTVCMDSFMVDVTEIDEIQVGQEVYIWDNENIMVEDIAKIYGTINYEVLSTISERIVREYVIKN